MEEVFGVSPSLVDNKYVISYGVIKELKAWINDKKLCVETQSDLSIKDEMIILDTNKKFRDFLEETTGFTAKERLKMARKEVNGE
jgi:hypothetical protein